MATNNNPLKRSRDILNAGDLIGSLRKGKMPNEIIDAHMKVLEAMEDTGGKGKITITIEYSIKKSLNGHLVSMLGKVATKIPYLAEKDDFNLHPGQLLCTESLDQAELKVDTVQEEPSSSVDVVKEDDNVTNIKTH